MRERERSCVPSRYARRGSGRGQRGARFRAETLQLVPDQGSADMLGQCASRLHAWCWAFDKNLTQQLTTHDPVAIVRLKSLVAGGMNLALENFSANQNGPISALENGPFLKSASESSSRSRSIRDRLQPFWPGPRRRHFWPGPTRVGVRSLAQPRMGCPP